MVLSPIGYCSVLGVQLQRARLLFARENPRLELARLVLATGAHHFTHAARGGLNRAQGMRIVTLGSSSATRSASAARRLPGARVVARDSSRARAPLPA